MISQKIVDKEHDQTIGIGNAMDGGGCLADNELRDEAG